MSIAQLERQNCQPDTIPKKDRIVYLRPYQSEDWGGYDEYNTDGVHPANVELACRAARIFGLEAAGIDMIATDISLPWYETGAVINEVNHKPQVAENTARAYMDLSFQDGQSEIPIECYVGDADAMTTARERLIELAQDSIGAFLTSHSVTLDNSGEIIRLCNVDGVFRRAEQLLQDTRVEYLLVVLQTDELLSTGLPFPAVSSVSKVNNNILNTKDISKAVEPGSADRLAAFLKQYQLEKIKPTE